MGERENGRRRRRPKPPRLAVLILRLLPRDRVEFIRGDLDERFARQVAGGASPSKARRRYWRDVVASVGAVAASGISRAFDRSGSAAAVADREAGRRLSGRDGGVLGGLASDTRFAIRALRRRPGYTVLAIATLSIGIGGTTAVFSIANGILFRPLPGLADPDRLAVIEFVAEQAADRSTGVSLPDLEALSQAAGFAGLAGNASVSLQVQTPAGEAFTATGEAVAGDYFGVLGVRPVLGRLPGGDELMAGSDPTVAVIGESFWAGAFGRDPDVLGRTLRVNGLSLVVVGVAGGGFRGTELRRPVDVWVPISAYAGLRHFESLDLNRPGRSFFQQLIGRVADDASFEAAQAELRGIFAGLVERQPETYERYVEYQPTVYPGVGIEPFVRDRTESALRIMFAIVSLVLLIACANVANLLLFRGVHRRAELAVRRALGASAGRVARQSLLESLVLALSGAALGMLLARSAAVLFAGAGLARIPTPDSSALDVRVLVFAVGTAVVTAILFGAAPAVLAAREGPGGAMRSGPDGSAGRARLRTGLSAFQLALSMTLLVSALLLLRTVRNLYDVEVGFDPGATTAFYIDPQPQGYEAGRALALYDRLVDRIGALPGIASVSASTHPPFVGSRVRGRARAPDDADWTQVDVDYVAPGFFATLDVPVTRGRELIDADLAGGNAVVIDETLAHRLFGGIDAVGRTLSTGSGRDERIVVGVVPDLYYGAPDSERRPTVFEPFTESYTFSGFLLVRGRLASADLHAAVVDAVRSVDPAIPVSIMRRLSDAFDDQLSEERLFARLLASFAIVALFLSAVGLYALISHFVAGRTREIGIRVALGAWRSRILAMVLGEAGVVAAVGIVFGVAGAFGFGRALENRLFGVAATDPLAWALAAFAFAAVTFVATLVPALAATRVDPVEALRTE